MDTDRTATAQPVPISGLDDALGAAVLDNSTSSADFACCDLVTVPFCCAAVRGSNQMPNWVYSKYLDGKVKSSVPKKLQGVFYMDGNPAPEDLYILNGFKWTPAAPGSGAGPTMRVYDTSPWTLSYPASCMGCMLYAFQSLCCCTSLEFKWESDALERARILPYVCFCVGPCTMIGTWDMVAGDSGADADIDAPEGGVTWRRISLGPDGKELPDGKGSYTLRKIISAEGKRVASQYGSYERATTGGQQMVRMW